MNEQEYFAFDAFSASKLKKLRTFYQTHNQLIPSVMSTNTNSDVSGASIDFGKLLHKAIETDCDNLNNYVHIPEEHTSKLSAMGKTLLLSGTTPMLAYFENYDNADTRKVKAACMFGLENMDVKLFDKDTSKAFDRIKKKVDDCLTTLGDVHLLMEQARADNPNVEFVLSDGKWNDIEKVREFTKNICELYPKTPTDGIDIHEEYIIEWSHPDIDLNLKSMLDRVVVNHNNKTIHILDWKTTIDGARYIPHSYTTYGYDLQASFYTDAVKHSDIYVEGYKVTFELVFINSVFGFITPCKVSDSDILVAKFGGYTLPRTIMNDGTIGRFFSNMESFDGYANELTQLDMHIYRQNNKIIGWLELLQIVEADRPR